jgi:hypothetical protein
VWTISTTGFSRLDRNRGRDGVTIEEGKSTVQTGKAMTVRHRVANCGNLSNVFRVVEQLDSTTEERVTRDEFMCQIGHPLTWVAERAVNFRSPHPYVLEVQDPLGLLRLGELMLSRFKGEGCE